MSDPTTESLNKLPKVRIVTPADINPPLGKEEAHMLHGIMEGARHNFQDGGYLAPAFFEMTRTGEMNIYAIAETKGSVFEWIQKRWPNNLASILLTEVWLARALKSDGAKPLVMPSQRIDRMERVMLVMWLPYRRISMISSIQRNPDRLGPWEIWDDTSNENLARPAGRMIGVPIPGEEKP